MAPECHLSPVRSPAGECVSRSRDEREWSEEKKKKTKCLFPDTSPFRRASSGPSTANVKCSFRAPAEREPVERRPLGRKEGRKGGIEGGREVSSCRKMTLLV